MGESARPLETLEPTPTPTPVSGIIQTVRPPEVAKVANIEDSTHDLLGAAMDELGLEPQDNEGVVISMDAARAAKIAKDAAEKAKLPSMPQTKKSLGETSFEANPTPETGTDASAAE
jgi:hypothetical protein